MTSIQNLFKKDFGAKNSFIENHKKKLKDNTDQAQSPKVSAVDEIKLSYKNQKSKNELVEKVYDFLKNITGIGLSSKKVEKKIAQFEQGKVKKEEVKKTLSRYKDSQDNALQSFGDIASAVTAVSTYFFLNNLGKKLKARVELNSIPNALRGLVGDAKGYQHWTERSLSTLIKSKTKVAVVATVIAAVVGGITKSFLLRLNRIGSKEFKLNKQEKSQLNKKELKKAKKALRKKRRKLNRRNFFTGSLNGLLSPILSLGAGAIGIPAYLAAGSMTRFFTGNSEDKSFKNYGQNIKNNAVLNTVTAAAIAIPVFKNVNYSRVLTKNLNKVVAKLKNVELKATLSSAKTAYEELEHKMLNSQEIQSIIRAPENIMSNEQKVEKLIEKNIFAAKFIQIGNGHYSLSKALKENCPPSRSIEEAQKQINKLWGSTDFKVSKLMGVGTIAETYLAKDKSGKEVAIKILKEGIDEAKILRDKESFISLITKGTSIQELTKEQQYLVNNIENLSEGILKEVDFVNEMEAAKKLAKYTKKAAVVEPVGAKQGIYVMEKAPGISVDTLQSYYNLKWYQSFYQNILKKSPDDKLYQKKLKETEEKIKKLKSRSPDFADVELSAKDIKRLLKDYIKVSAEQFSKIEKGGKTVHADIHPGNIFINLEALKSKKGKLFTLIDTGNTIDVTRQQAKDALRLTTYIKNGNVDEIMKTAMDDVILPKGLSKDEAVKNVAKDLKAAFFDSETNINSMSSDEFGRVFNNILRKYDIIPNDTQLNLNKAKKSARNSFDDLLESFFEEKLSKHGDIEEMSKTQQAKVGASIVKDVATLGAKYIQEQTMQETRNLTKMPLKEIRSYIRSKTRLKTNSEDYLTYKMKQHMKSNEKSKYETAFEDAI